MQHLPLYIYIVSIWRTRKENLRIGNLKCVIVRKLREYQKFIKNMPNQKSEKLYKDLESIDLDNIINL